MARHHARGLCGFSGGGVTAPETTVTSLEIMPSYGQSENRPSASTLAAVLDAATPGQICYTAGLVTEAGASVGPYGAGLAALDQTREASGFAGAEKQGRVSPAFTMQYARAARWRDAGQAARGAVIGDYGFGGQAIERWMTADAAPLGRNQLYWLRESKRLADRQGITLTCPYVWLFQGTSAKDQAAAAYRAAFDAAHGATLTEAQRLFGQAPKLVVVVNGGDVDTNNDLYAIPGAQYRIALDHGGIIGTWQRIYPIRDQNIHIDDAAQVLIGETCDWAAAEVEAGRKWNITYAVAKAGATVTVSFDLRDGETLMQRADLYTAYGGAATCANFGFEAEGGILGVVPDLAGNSVTITLASASSGWLRFAHQVQDCSALTDAAGVTMSAHRTTLFGSHTRASRFVAGGTLWRALPGFRGTFQGNSFVPEAVK